MALAAVIFSLLAACVRAAARPQLLSATAGAAPLPGGELAFFRYLFGLVFLFALHARRGGLSDLLGNDRHALLLRGVYGGLASVFYFLGLEHASLTHATLLNYTSVIWAPCLAVWALKERLGRGGALAVAVALVGVLLVTRPEIGRVRGGDAMALLSGVLAGASIVQIRRVRQGESAFAVFFWFNLLGLPMSLVAVLFAGEPWVWPAPVHVPLLLAIGATSVAGQLLLTYGYREISTAQGSLITLNAVVFSALLAHAVFGEPLPVATLVGGALILASAASLVVSRPAARPQRGNDVTA